MGAPAAQQEPGSKSLVLVVAIVVLGAGGAAAAMLTGRDVSKVSPAAARVAVLPFQPEEPHDTGLARLGIQLAVSVARTLATVTDVHTVDSVSVAALARGPVSLARADTIARALGASSYVRGTIEREHGRIQVELELRSTARGGPAAEIVSGGPADDFGLVADSVSWAVLRRLWRGHHMPQPHAAGPR